MFKIGKHVMAIPPGETIKDILEEREMPQKEFAQRMGMSEKHICKLLAGDVHLTVDVAYRLEGVLGIPVKFSMGLETLYREKLYLIEEEERIENENKLAKEYPFDEMLNISWIGNEAEHYTYSFKIKRFFEVSNLDIVNKVTVGDALCCSSSREDYDFNTSTMCWIQKAKLESRKMETARIDLRKLKTRIEVIKSAYGLENEIAMPMVREALRECGIAFIMLPKLKELEIKGCAFRNGSKYVLAVVEDDEELWRNIFHELGHIVKKHFTNKELTTREKEQRAAEYASEMIEECKKAQISPY